MRRETSTLKLIICPDCTPLEGMVQTTEGFGGRRGALRLWLVWALRRWPVLACTAVGLVERVLISDRLVRTARISGQIVAYFAKPVSTDALRTAA